MGDCLARPGAGDVSRTGWTPAPAGAYLAPAPCRDSYFARPCPPIPPKRDMVKKGSSQPEIDPHRTGLTVSGGKRGALILFATIKDSQFLKCCLLWKPKCGSSPILMSLPENQHSGL
eukprot:g50037.t1